MLKSYIENKKNLIFTGSDGLRLEQQIGTYLLGLLRTDLDGLMQYVDDILEKCDNAPEEVPSGSEIAEHMERVLSDAHPLFTYFYPLNETTLRNCFHKRFRALCIRRPALIDQDEFKKIYDRIPFKFNHAYLEDYFRKLQYTRIKKYYAEHVEHDPKLTQQLQIEATYLTEKTRSLDKFLSEHESFPEDLTEYLKTLSDRLKERMQAIFDMECEPVNTLPTEKRYFLDNLLHGKQSIFVLSNYSTSYSIALTGRIAEKFKKAESTEDYVKVLEDCPLNYVEELPVGTFEEAIEVEIRGMLQMGVRLKKCRNCGHYFIPVLRADEIYCNSPFMGQKTCRQVGYELKQDADGLLKAYRTAYKTQHAKMRRNRSKSDYKEKIFLPWVQSAKEQLERAQKGEITAEEFNEWLTKHRKEAV